MNQRSLIAIIILAGIGSIGSVLAYSGTISAGQGNFNNVLITGTCTGCGGEGSFTSYSLVVNQTITGTTAQTVGMIKIANDKSLIYENGNHEAIVLDSGQTLVSLTNIPANTIIFQMIDSSTQGKYKVLINNTSGNIDVIKNNSILQHLTPTAFGFLNQNSIAISSDGKYIVTIGEDGVINEARIQIWQGS